MEKAFSVTINDCEIQTFRAGGKGGQKQNKTESGVRIIHHPSGSRGESREYRTQLENKRAAFKRMTQDPKFNIWINKILYGFSRAEEEVEQMMQREKDFVLEVKQDGRWVKVDKLDEEC